MGLFRRLRGVVGTAIAWGIAWVPLSIAVIGIAALLGAELPPSRFYLPLLIRSAIGGAINGAVFAVILSIAGRRHTPETLSAARLMACGAAGGAVFPAVIMGAVLTQSASIVTPLQILLSLGTGAVLGTACAATTLYAIRRAALLERGDRAVPIPQRTGAA